MTETNLTLLTDQQLYDRFVEMEIELGELYYHLRRYKRLHVESMKVMAEIVSRLPHIAKVFRAGLHHENPWVRTATVKFCIDECREEALAALKGVADLGPLPVAVRAGIAYDHYTKGNMIGEETKELTRRILARTPLPRRE